MTDPWSSLTDAPLALGCAPLGNLYEPISDETAHGVVDAAWELGVRVFDTAPLYGHGLSEARLGAALGGRPRDQFVVATKVGRVLVPAPPDDPALHGMFFDVPPVKPVFDFSRDGVLRSLEASLARLGMDRVDLLHVHDPDDHLDAALDEAIPALVELRDEGVIGAVGVGTNHAWIAERFVDAGHIDWVLLAGRCTLLDASGTRTLLPRCEAAGVNVFAAGVFNSGVLADPKPGAPFHYAPAPPDVLARVEAIGAVCARHEVPLAAAALQYPLRVPGVTAVLVGARHADEITADRAFLDHPIPPGLWSDLAQAGLLDGE